VSRAGGQMKAPAGADGRNGEAEHGAILAAALTGPRKLCFADFLAAMPDAGSDADFERVQDG